jgi:hypothetical protein
MESHSAGIYSWAETYTREVTHMARSKTGRARAGWPYSRLVAFQRKHGIAEGSRIYRELQQNAARARWTNR